MSMCWRLRKPNKTRLLHAIWSKPIAPTISKKRFAPTISMMVSGSPIISKNNRRRYLCHLAGRHTAATSRARQSQMFAQGGALIVMTEDAASLQNRHHPIDEILQAARQGIGHQIEAVGSTGAEP